MLSLVMLAFGLLTTLHLFAASDGKIAASGAYQSGRPLLYIASLSGEVTAYDPASSGVVSPVRRRADPITGLKDSWAVAFDTAEDLFVQTFLGDSTTGVFGPDVNGIPIILSNIIAISISWKNSPIFCRTRWQG